MNPPGGTAAPSAAETAKATLRRLALSRREPTPELYAQAWAEETGQPPALSSWPPRVRQALDRLLAGAGAPPEGRAQLVQQLAAGQWDAALDSTEKLQRHQERQARQWSELLERLQRGTERASRTWSAARRKDSLQRVLQSSGSDLGRLQHRLQQLLQAWEGDAELAPETVETAGVESEAGAPAAEHPPAIVAALQALQPSAEADGAPPWHQALQPLARTLRLALPEDVQVALQLADELARVADEMAMSGLDRARLLALEGVCTRAGQLLSHRHHLMRQVHRLSQELAASLAELSEDDSWVQGQLQLLGEHLAQTPSARGVEQASQLLGQARQRQLGLRSQRDEARDALRQLIHQMLAELAALDEHTGRFGDGLARHSQTIEQAGSLAELAGAVRSLLDDTRSVHGVVQATRERMNQAHGRAQALEAQVRDLEAELRKVSQELSTDVLTQVANRRGLMLRFEEAQRQLEREGGTLSVALLDIDNFKRLNDTLGHAAGDQALVALAQRVKASLRPQDSLARFGGEEFVVLLPGTLADEAQQALTRLQRSLSASLFMHEAREVLVTFSAGVTAYRTGEKLDEALERADMALYEAKRTGKNRTCIG
ncbi:GGDEF domain-containing protein [Ideonella livida]|nr:GGDEF domain-containing protein [Ideonella livida]